ncbi:MAG: hypothetical protein FWF81_02630 [Defluviitaleaceae bacterium]|nr:hypothetical protein [Defluviitaleaceae bacterium]
MGGAKLPTYPTAGAGDSLAGDYSAPLSQLPMYDDGEPPPQGNGLFRRLKNLFPRRKSSKNRLNYARHDVIMNADEQPRDENGRFAETGSAKQKSYDNGKKSKLGAKDVKRYTDRLVGQETSNGTEITEISEHTFDRIAERRISPKRFEDMMQKTPSISKTDAGCDVYHDRGSNLVIDRTSGVMVTVMWGRAPK